MLISYRSMTEVFLCCSPLWKLRRNFLQVTMILDWHIKNKLRCVDLILFHSKSKIFELILILKKKEIWNHNNTYHFVFRNAIFRNSKEISDYSLFIDIFIRDTLWQGENIYPFSIILNMGQIRYCFAWYVLLEWVLFRLKYIQ